MKFAFVTTLSGIVVGLISYTSANHTPDKTHNPIYGD